MQDKTRKVIIKLLWLICLAPVLLVALWILCTGLFADIPSFSVLEDPKNNLATEVISEDGAVLSTFHIENRSYVQYDELPPCLLDALLATEDVRFYRHSGIDFRSLARVGVKTLLLGRRSSGGGGSTITQQLAKSLFPRDTTRFTFPGADKAHLVTLKFKEWITAVKLERNYTKEEIVTMYLNTVFFGSNAFGIRTAAFTFFGKHPSQLTTEEAAVLVGMVNKPTRYNPARNYEASLTRRNHVISQMEKYHYIKEAVRDSLMALPITLSYSAQDHNSGLAPYFRDMLRRVMGAKEPQRSRYAFAADYTADSLRWATDPLYGWLEKNPKPDGSLYNLDVDGLKIYTTINAKMQLYAEQAVEEHLSKALQPALTKELKYRNVRPFANDTPKAVVDMLMNQAIRWSDRYRSMKAAGASEAEIKKAFDTPVKMRVFSWEAKATGYGRDTTMTPRDSIVYYKSFLRSAFMAMEPETGHVKAYVGGPNYRYFKYDNASQAKRQVGSTIKPYLYTLAMQEGYSPCDKVVNVPQTFIVGDTTWTPESTDKPEYIGRTVTLKWGLTKSSNNISAYLMKQFGPNAMVQMCRKLGIHSHLDPVVSLCLGPADLRLTEMVGAYNTFPSQGVHIEPLFVTRIEDKSGNLLASFIPAKREAISDQTAYLMINLMQGVVNEGTAARIRSLYMPQGQVAGKTGTTNDQSDGWFMGVIPKLTAGVWVGAEDRQVHFSTLAMGGGSNMALPIWGLFMKRVMADPSLGYSITDEFAAPPGFDASRLQCDGSDEADSSEGETEYNPFF